MGGVFPMGCNPTHKKIVLDATATELRRVSRTLGRESLDLACIHENLRWGENPIAAARISMIFLPCFEK
jgi:hypothetical protein